MLWNAKGAIFNYIVTIPKF